MAAYTYKKEKNIYIFGGSNGPERLRLIGYLVLALEVTELDGETESKLGKLLHVVKVDVGDIIVGRVDVRAYQAEYCWLVEVS